MLPGRGTAVELAFFKRFATTKDATYNRPPLSARQLQLNGLSLGYSTTVLAADQLLSLLYLHHDRGVEAFVLRVVDCMHPATRSLADITLEEEIRFAFGIQQALFAAFPVYNSAFLASLSTKWTAAAMMQMHRKRGLLDVSEVAQELMEGGDSRWRTDIAQHGLKRCALPSCDKPEASVQQYKFCSACRSVWYCSAEHGALHWTEHKSICRSTTAAQQAADDAGAGAA